jgi:hypothetical protein
MTDYLLVVKGLLPKFEWKFNYNTTLNSTSTTINLIKDMRSTHFYKEQINNNSGTIVNGDNNNVELEKGDGFMNKIGDAISDNTLTFGVIVLIFGLFIMSIIMFAPKENLITTKDVITQFKK